MTGEEIQRQLDDMEAKRNLMIDAAKRYSLETDSVLANIRHTVSTMQKNVQEIVESEDGTKLTRNFIRA